MWHLVMRPNERGWRGGGKERDSEDLLDICTMQVPGERVIVRKRGGA